MSAATKTTGTTKTTATKATTTAAPQEALEAKNYIRHEHDTDKDWSYLADKEPDDSHVLKAAMMTKYGPEDFEITPKQVQVFLAMHRWVQKSDANQSRDDFRGRELGSVVKGYATLVEHVSERIQKEGQTAPVVSNPNITGTTAADYLPVREAEEVAAAEADLEEAVAAVEAEPKPKATTRRRRTPAAKKAEEASAE